MNCETALRMLSQSSKLVIAFCSGWSYSAGMPLTFDTDISDVLIDARNDPLFNDVFVEIAAIRAIEAHTDAMIADIYHLLTNAGL